MPFSGTALRRRTTRRGGGSGKSSHLVCHSIVAIICSLTYWKYLCGGLGASQRIFMTQHVVSQHSPDTSFGHGHRTLASISLAMSEMRASDRTGGPSWPACS